MSALPYRYASFLTRRHHFTPFPADLSNPIASGESLFKEPQMARIVADFGRATARRTPELECARVRMVSLLQGDKTTPRPARSRAQTHPYAKADIIASSSPENPLPAREVQPRPDGHLADYGGHNRKPNALSLPLRFPSPRLFSFATLFPLRCSVFIA